MAESYDKALMATGVEPRSSPSLATVPTTRPPQRPWTWGSFRIYWPSAEAKLGVVSRKSRRRHRRQLPASAGRVPVSGQRASGGRHVEHGHGSTTAGKRRRARRRLRLAVAVGRWQRRRASTSLSWQKRASYLQAAFTTMKSILSKHMYTMRNS